MVWYDTVWYGTVEHRIIEKSPIVTSSKGGFSPMGKLMVFRLITSSTDDIFVNGP